MRFRDQFSTLRRVTTMPQLRNPLEQKPKDKVEKVLNVPNILTFGRLFSAPVIGWLILNDYHTASLALFATAGFTDAIDGWIARKWNLQTVVGSVIDPMADKTLMTIITICLAVKGVFPIWLAGIILGRDVALAISAIYFRYISLPPPKTMKRYWDFSLPSAEVHPTTISKLNTALQLGLVGAAVMDPLMGGSADWAAAFEAMQYTVATTTVWSGASYIYTKDAVKILKHPDVPASFIKRYQKDEEWKELEKKEAEKETEKNEEVKP
ncbi:Similar to Uncharacterized CDP-alcohol phosphatidyltransferase class-I family protein C22A12.08c; acc. no. O13899 [Pyronema omphalodes CBS 100304]|uniref:Similar to Uncharacterized CDP-alcohol phosphatidyltransferase class-I family protein C22A12.08c acc. no. O13899 n=1 Tax=Pyronema omphalodes (strain CBS 100304) TaxID=1076935 RepID=U4LLD3_PYROM|nr:Similar to Uncharacterized CDP-alcohol phosphatidyltransferase class-I family protein C22A12.08c; acc. no. O13899 [Pyronema omphalodes CBS 100304]